MAIKTFTAGAVLTAADTNTYLANSGLVYVSSTTVGSAVSSVAVSSAFSSTYDNYKIIYSGGAGSSLITLGMSLGASTAGYSSVVNYALYATPTTPVSAGDNSQSKWGYIGYASTNYTSLNVDLMNPFAALYTAYGAAPWAAVTVAGTSAGIHAVATSYTGFTIYAMTGTITGGTITVYGYRKA
jgi:hypothetical protein